VVVVEVSKPKLLWKS